MICTIIVLFPAGKLLCRKPPDRDFSLNVTKLIAINIQADAVLLVLQHSYKASQLLFTVRHIYTILEPGCLPTTWPGKGMGGRFDLEDSNASNFHPLACILKSNDHKTTIVLC